MYAFDKTRRLLNRHDFGYVFDNATKLKNNELTLLFCKNTHKSARLGLVVSKKAITKAHDRNRIKRLLRESFRLNPQMPAVDVVILVKPKALSVSSQTMNAHLDKLWHALSEQHIP